MDVVGIDHVALVTEDVDKTASVFETLLDLRFGERVEYTTQTQSGENELVGRLSNGPEAFDLLEPRNGDNEVRDFLDEYGPGLYAIALQVRDVEQAVAELERKGIKPVGHVSNAEYTEYFFHPDDFEGVFVFLAERPHPFESNTKQSSE